MRGRFGWELVTYNQPSCWPGLLLVNFIFYPFFSEIKMSNEAIQTEEDIYNVLIVAAGPCDLSIAARLREHTPAALFTDEEHRRYIPLDKQVRPQNAPPTMSGTAKSRGSASQRGQSTRCSCSTPTAAPGWAAGTGCSRLLISRISEVRCSGMLILRIGMRCASLC